MVDYDAIELAADRMIFAYNATIMNEFLTNQTSDRKGSRADGTRTRRSYHRDKDRRQARAEKVAYLRPRLVIEYDEIPEAW